MKKKIALEQVNSLVPRIDPYVREQLLKSFSSEGVCYFEMLVTQWMNQKQKLSFEVMVSWDLIGSYVIQKWIKETMITEGKKQGIQFWEEPQAAFYLVSLPRVQITNGVFPPHKPSNFHCI